MSNVYRPPSFTGPIDLDLSRNEGRAAIDRISLGSEELTSVISTYPDTRELTAALAERHRVPVGKVLVTAGADDALMRCFLAGAGSTVVATTPSFEMIRRYATQMNTPLVEIPWWDGEFPIDLFLDESSGTAGMAVIVSPNNPTGNTVAPADLRKVADAYPLVVLDAAYAEFADEDLTPTALEADNVVVIRTLSKAFGLAGLRVGYLLGSEETVRRLTAFGSPYSMSGLSAALATEVVTNDVESAHRYASGVAGRRRRLYDILEDLDCGPMPSQANFVLATDVGPSWLVPGSASLGVGLRRFDDRPDLARCVRITVPSDESGFERLEKTLRTVLDPQALLFDLDGVLVDVSKSFRTAIVATAARFGVTVSGEDISSAKAAGNASDDWDLTRRLCAEAGVDVSFETVRDEFERIYQGTEGTDGLKLTEALLVDFARLESWSARLPLGIVTARPRKDTIEVLDRFGIAELFSTVVTREDAPSKPDPAPVRLALERLGVNRAWMVGDTVDDIAAARSAGVVPIGVATSADDGTGLAAAARVLGSVNEIKEVFDVT